MAIGQKSRLNWPNFERSLVRDAAGTKERRADTLCPPLQRNAWQHKTPATTQWNEQGAYLSVATEKKNTKCQKEKNPAEDGLNEFFLKSCNLQHNSLPFHCEDTSDWFSDYWGGPQRRWVTGYILGLWGSWKGEQWTGSEFRSSIKALLLESWRKQRSMSSFRSPVVPGRGLLAPLLRDILVHESWMPV